MKSLPFKRILLSNTVLKIVSIIVGYSFWYIMSSNNNVTIETTVPLSFTYDTTEYSVDAPENITITLQGKRLDIYNIEISTCAAHIDITHHTPGKYAVMLKEKHLFLPSSITLLHYNPSPLFIDICKKL